MIQLILVFFLFLVVNGNISSNLPQNFEHNYSLCRAGWEKLSIFFCWNFQRLFVAKFTVKEDTLSLPIKLREKFQFHFILRTTLRLLCISNKQGVSNNVLQKMKNCFANSWVFSRAVPQLCSLNGFFGWNLTISCKIWETWAMEPSDWQRDKVTWQIVMMWVNIKLDVSGVRE